MPPPREIAVFVTPHGFGHAARAAAVMQEIDSRRPYTNFRIFTTVPRWFFAQSIRRFSIYPVRADLGMCQHTALKEDPAGTVRMLDYMLPWDLDDVKDLVRQIRLSDLVLCDIAPLGIAVAHAAGLPAILQENFTWPWIYESYVDEYPGFRPHIDYLRQWIDAAEYRVQTEPVCERAEDATLTVGPMSRQPLRPAAEVRQLLGLTHGERIVMVSMGGSAHNYEGLIGADLPAGVVCLVAGAVDRQRREGDWILLPHNSDFYHPDLVHTVDAMIGKVGYSTLAEVYTASVPYGYLLRPTWRESGPMDDFLKAHVPGRRVHEHELRADSWKTLVDELLAAPRPAQPPVNGAVEMADFIFDL